MLQRVYLCALRARAFVCVCVFVFPLVPRIWVRLCVYVSLYVRLSICTCMRLYVFACLSCVCLCTFVCACERVCEVPVFELYLKCV